MATLHADDGDPVPELLAAINLVDETIALAETALADNPPLHEQRALNELLLRLRTERAVLEAELDAALNSQSAVQGPSAAQVREIERLTARVESATNATLSASQTIQLATRVFELATRIISHA